MHFKRHIELKKGQLDITPLVDMVFLLLIFFLLTSNFISQQGIRVNLPSAVSSKPLPLEQIIIFITDKDQLVLNDKTININQLDSKLKMTTKTKGRILIKADKKASLGKVVEIWDLCREAGIANINIATLERDK